VNPGMTLIFERATFFTSITFLKSVGEVDGGGWRRMDFF
jgi:hypothetical protein